MKKTVILLLCFSFIAALSACTKNSATGEEAATASQKSEQTAEAAENEDNNETLKTLDEGRIEIVSIKGTDGLFVEKGEEIQVNNIASIVIKNRSDKMLEYAKISYRVNKYERADFEISALPAGESAVVMESLAREYSESDDYECDEASLLTAYKNADENPDGVEIESGDGIIAVKNVSDKAINATVIYKYYIDGQYYGGIAFSGKFEKVAPGETVTKESDRINEKCRIVNIEIEEI